MNMKLFVWCLLALVPAALAQPFTLEQAMSAPFPSDLSVAPTGGKLAWVLDENGARNIWVAEAPDYRGHRLTHYTTDDGQEIAQLAWTNDGAALLYTRGGDFETAGSDPNPASLPGGVEQAIWIVPFSGGDPRKLAEGQSAAVSSARVAYLKKNEIWSVDLAGKDKPEQLVHAKGEAAKLRWSPDGKRLAFVSERGDHSFVAVYDPAAKTLRYLDPSVDSDSAPVWSPDSKQIAFVRIAASTRAFAFGPVRTAEPWSIRIADATSGVGRELWRANAGAGSAFHGFGEGEPLLWASGNRIVFPWEGTGWLHLYSISVSGGAAIELTPGEFEVQDDALSADHSDVLLTSNEGDIDRRHLWRVPAAGGKTVAVTTGDGIEWLPVPVADTIAFLRSGARTPAHAAVLAHDLAPSDFPAIALVPPQPVVFSAADGMQIHGQLFLPSDTRKKHAAVLFLHGGSRRQMLLGWHSMRYYHNAYAMNQYLASQGFVVLSVNYRSGIGYGLDFREALNYGATGASEFQDVLGAGLYLRGRPDVDPARIGLWGGSYGGYLTALGLSRASYLFAAGVDFHGVHDWNLEIPTFVKSYDPSADPNAARLAFESSPLSSISTWRSPVLLIHGDDDRNVPFNETVRLVEALRKQHVEFEQLIFPDEIHGFLTHARWLEAYQATAEYLSRHLNIWHDGK